MKWTIIEGQDCSPYMTDIHVGSILVPRDVTFLLLLISYVLCRIEFIFLLNQMVYSTSGCVLSFSSSLQMLFVYYTAQYCQSHVYAFQVTNNFGINKFALDIHILFIFDAGVSEGELTSCEVVFVLCVQHVINFLSSIALSFIFLFMCNVLFRACNVVSFYELLFMY